MAKANKIYKAAVIGCGNIGASAGNYNKAVQPGTHAGAYLACKRTKLMALVETNYERHEYLRRNFPKVKLFVDVEEMLFEIKPDIVSVATPSAFHLKPVELAAAHKTPAIICEKPISYSINEAERMIEVCKKSGSALFINHQRHFDPLLNKWKEKINKGFLGKIYQGNIYYYNGLFNNGTHWLDLLRSYLGMPVSVTAKVNSQTSDKKDDPNVDGILYFKGGARVALQSLSANYGYFCFTLFGEKGMLDITNLGFEAQYRKKIKNKNYKGFFELAPAKREGKPRSMIISAVGHAINCLDGQSRPISTGEDGLAVLKILLALKESADKNGIEIKIKK